MFRYVQLDIPANTAESAPVTKTIHLRHGVITRWWVGFPDGCADLVKAAVYHYEHRVLPRDEKEWLFWNNFIFEIPDSYKLEDEPYEIEVRAWSDDDTYEMYVVVGVALEPIQEISLADLYRVFRQFITAMVGPTPE